MDINELVVLRHLATDELSAEELAYFTKSEPMRVGDWVEANAARDEVWTKVVMDHTDGYAVASNERLLGKFSTLVEAEAALARVQINVTTEIAGLSVPKRRNVKVLETRTDETAGEPAGDA